MNQLGDIGHLPALHRHSILFDIYLCRLKLIHPQADSFTGEFSPRGRVVSIVQGPRSGNAPVTGTLPELDGGLEFSYVLYGLGRTHW